MKKKTVVTAAAISLLGLGAFAPQAFAAGTDSKDTTGSVEITAGSDLTFEGFIKPGTYDEKIDMTTGTNGYGEHGTAASTLRFNWVPNFKFGTVSATAYDQVIDSQIHAYTDDADDTQTEKPIYQFVQVQDMTGNASSQFRVTLAATHFSTAGASPTVLTNTQIRLKGFTTTNNLEYNTPKSNTELLTGILIPTNSYTAVPMDDSSVQILAAKTPFTADDGTRNGSNGSISSLVFHSEYDPAATLASTAKNNEVQLFVPSNEMIQGQYTSTLTWTLDNTL